MAYDHEFLDLMSACRRSLLGDADDLRNLASALEIVGNDSLGHRLRLIAGGIQTTAQALWDGHGKKIQSDYDETMSDIGSIFKTILSLDEKK